MNLQSWILLIVVAACFAAAVVYMIKNKGSCSCGGNCSQCGKRCGKDKS